MIQSGRSDRKDPKFNFSLNIEGNELKLLRAIAKSEAITAAGKAVHNYKPILKHPLPTLNLRYEKEYNLQRVLSTKLEKQAMSAVALGDAWVLEEVYMRGAPVSVSDINGFTPIHLAAQTNNYECIMVLLNIGVDVNVNTLSGITPLYLAQATDSSQAISLLKEHGALRLIQPKRFAPGATVLDLTAPGSSTTPEIPTALSKLSKSLCLPGRHLMY